MGLHHHEEHVAGDRRIVWAIAVNLLLTLVQSVGGLLAGSLALVADAIHNLSDAFALVIAFGARRLARRPADDRMTFGYARAEIVAALINYTTLILLGLYLTYEAVWRFIEPQPVEGWIVVFIAGAALLVDALTALLTYSMSKQSLNIRAAFLHNLADALASVGVILAGVVILIYDWTLIDPLVTLMIAGYILWQSVLEIRAVIHMLMLGTPHEVDASELIGAVRGLDGVVDMHHIHLWEMAEHQSSLEAHIVVRDDDWADAESIRQRIGTLLAQRFDLFHVTIELESESGGCRSLDSSSHCNQVPANLSR
ncbi:MAG: cation diffusion facilitator family transporter [Gammaproteobacteria bacterium]|nr:cation diffusion facilitator family transporter [Gammaproteobacteria bacterium]